MDIIKRLDRMIDDNNENNELHHALTNLKYHGDHMTEKEIMQAVGKALKEQDRIDNELKGSLPQ